MLGASTSLFPYTTLFRSRFEEQHLRGAAGAAAKADARGQHPGVVHHDQVAGVHVVGEIGSQTVLDPTAVDRKSTRLNSSHLVISYAVFCLKKKKKCIITT